MIGSEPTVEELQDRSARRAWGARGRALVASGRNHQWEIADWMNAGESQWRSEAYDVAARIVTDVSRKTLREWAYVARSVPASFRKDVLSFTHHALVAGMEPADQEKWLTNAAVGKTVAQLKKEIREAREKHAVPVCIQLPRDLYDKLQLNSRASGMTEEALVIRAVSKLLESDGEQIRAQAEAELAARREKERAEYEARQVKQARERAFKAAREEQKERQQEQQRRFVGEKLRDLRDKLRQAAEELGTSGQDLDKDDSTIGLEAAARKKAAQDACESITNELRAATLGAEEEALRLFPVIPDPDDLRQRAHAARWAAKQAEGYALNTTLQAEYKTQAAHQLTEEADQLENDLAAVEAQIGSSLDGPQTYATP